MKPDLSFSTLLERFFTQRLIAQRQASPHTIASYRDTFRLLLQCASQRLHKSPSALGLADLDPELIGAFLDGLEQQRGNRARSRNLRLTAIRSFFRYAAFEAPAQSGLIQRVLDAEQAIREEVGRIPDEPRNRCRVGGARPAHVDGPSRSRLPPGRRTNGPSAVGDDQSPAPGCRAWHGRTRSLRRQRAQGAMHAAHQAGRPGAQDVVAGARAR